MSLEFTFKNIDRVAGRSFQFKAAETVKGVPEPKGKNRLNSIKL